MSKTLYSNRQQRLAELVTEKRKKAGLSQAAVAKALHRHQPFVAKIENGERRLDVIEFLDLAKAVGFDPYEIIREIESVGPKRR